MLETKTRVAIITRYAGGFFGFFFFLAGSAVGGIILVSLFFLWGKAYIDFLPVNNAFAGFVEKPNQISEAPYRLIKIKFTSWEKRVELSNYNLPGIDLWESSPGYLAALASDDQVDILRDQGLTVEILSYQSRDDRQNQVGNGFCGFSTYQACLGNGDCKVSGCAGQICQGQSAPDLPTSCEWQACYDRSSHFASCGCQANKCSWY